MSSISISDMTEPVSLGIFGNIDSLSIVRASLDRGVWALSLPVW